VKYCPLNPSTACMEDCCQWWVEWEHRGEVAQGCALEALAACVAQMAHRLNCAAAMGGLGGADG